MTADRLAWLESYADLRILSTLWESRAARRGAFVVVVPR